jgi:hypothetical protein
MFKIRQVGKTLINKSTGNSEFSPRPQVTS